MKLFRVSIPIVFVLIFSLAIFSRKQEILYLVPNIDVPAYNHLMWSYKDPPDIVLEAGESIRISRCDVDKSDASIVIETNGREYFVGHGEFSVHRRHATLPEIWNGTSTLTCEGLFDGPSFAGA